MSTPLVFSWGLLLLRLPATPLKEALIPKLTVSQIQAAVRASYPVVDNLSEFILVYIAGGVVLLVTIIRTIGFHCAKLQAIKLLLLSPSAVVYVTRGSDRRLYLALVFRASRLLLTLSFAIILVHILFLGLLLKWQICGLHGRVLAKDLLSANLRSLKYRATRFGPDLNGLHFRPGGLGHLARNFLLFPVVAGDL